MKLKKIYNDNVVIYFEILNSVLVLENEKILEDIIISLSNFVFINRNKPFNELIKIQQKYPKHILIDFDSSSFDELKFIIKSIYNFLIETNQLKNFIIDSMEIPIENSCIIVYATEIMQNKITNNITFSPTIRSYWSNPLLIECILKKP